MITLDQFVAWLNTEPDEARHICGLVLSVRDNQEEMPDAVGEIVKAVLHGVNHMRQVHEMRPDHIQLGDELDLLWRREGVTKQQVAGLHRIIIATLDFTESL